MNFEALFTASDRVLIADAARGIIDDYQQHTDGNFIRYISNDIGAEYVAAAKEELAKKFNIDVFRTQWQPLTLPDDVTTLPREFTLAWLNQGLAKE